MRTLRLLDRETGEITFEGSEVSARNPCPICAQIHIRQGWCLIDSPRGLIICPRVESKQKIGSAGWLHSVDGKETRVAKASVQVWKKSGSETDFNKMQSKLAANATIKTTGELSKLLNIDVKYLDLYGCGWDGRCWTFPMWSRGEVCGIRIRDCNNRKFCVVGSQLGLFMPKKTDEGDLFICEGESDSASLTSLGFSSVGRAGCLHSTAECVDISYNRNVVIASDNDTAGRNGARALKEAVKSKAKSVVVISPPVGNKDFRMWVGFGAKASDIMAITKARRGW